MTAAVHDAQGRTRPATSTRVVAALAAVFWGLLFFGLIDLLAFVQGPEFHAALVLSTGWGLLFLVLVALPLCVVTFASSASAASVPAQLLAVAIALAAAALLSGSPRHLLPAAGLAVTSLCVTPWRRGGLRSIARGWRPSWPSLALIAAAAAPCLDYAWHAARSTNTAKLTDDTVGLDHWPVQAAFPLAVLLVAALAAGRPPGWRVPAWSVGIAGGWFAVVCFVEPGLTASAGRGWALAVAGWIVLFGIVVRREPSPAAGVGPLPLPVDDPLGG